MANPKVVGNRYWCPVCKEYVQLLTIMDSARLVNVKRRTIYRYIEDELVYAVIVASKTLRVCSSCLVKPLNNENPSSLKKE